MHTGTDILEEFNERIAIMVIDGEQKEADAVRHAYFAVRQRYGREALPKEVVDEFAKIARSRNDE